MPVKKLVQSVTVGAGGAASIEFTSIPQTGTDLLLVVSARSTQAVIYDYLFLSFNGSSSNFSARFLDGNGSVVESGTWSNAVVDSSVVGASATANTFGSSQFYISNYAGSTNKSYSNDSVTENNASTAYQSIHAGLWSNTAAVSSIGMITGGNFVAGSTASLYIITKGSGGATVA